MAAVDSAEHAGWAIVERQPGQREHVIAWGERRIRTAGDVVAGVDDLATHSPEVVAIEGAYVRVNAHAGLVLAELVGRWRQELERRGLATVTTLASTWQAAILSGLISIRSPREARKAAARTWARRSLGLELGENAADAVALAIWLLRSRMAPQPLGLPFLTGRRQRRAG